VSNDLTYDQLLSLSLPTSRSYKIGVYGTPNSTVYAPNGDSAVRTGGNDVMIGSSGDNTFFVYSGGDSVVEQPGGGIDTVKSTATFALSDNVENLFLIGNGPTITGSIIGLGNSLNNIITGDAGNQSLDGGGGNDLLTGGAGDDLFIVKAGQGSDLITDFGNGNDMLRLQGFGFTSFSQVMGAATQIGNDVVIQLPGDQAVGLKNVTLSSLNASQFQLDLDRSNLVQVFADQFDQFSRNDPITNPTGTWRTFLKNDAGPSGRTITTEGEQQLYVDETLGVNPFSTENGILTISARDTPASMLDQFHGYKYTSGMVSSKATHSQLYGVFEIRAKLPADPSTWPAFWLLPTDNTPRTEIDIFERPGAFPYLVTNTLHSGATGFKTTSGLATYVEEASTTFHTYAVDWQPDTITWYVDGVETKRIATPADMHKPMYMLATLGVGSGGIQPSGPLLADMQIDYIAAYERGTAITGTGIDDVFHVSSRDQVIVEPAGGTNATVYSSIDYLLPDNIQTLILTGSDNLSAFANEKDSVLIGNAGSSLLQGSFGNDLIIGGDAYNTLLGNDGNDTIVTGSWSNLVKGGNGYDTLVLAGESSAWFTQLGRGTGTVTNRTSGSIETTFSIENVRFDNGLLSFEGFGMTGGPAQIYRLYNTALGRAPTVGETAALLMPTPALPRNWTNPFADGMSLADVAGRIMASAEYQADTRGMTISEQVGWFYKAALLNPSDGAGLGYWQDQAAQGVPLATILSGISESAPVVAAANGVTVNGIFVPDNPAAVSIPVAPALEFTMATSSTGAVFSTPVATLANAASDPEGQRFAVTNLSRAEHGTIAVVNGQVTFTANAYFTGDAHFAYTVVNTDLVASTGIVTIHVTGKAAPGYIYDAGLTTARTYDFSGDGERHLLVAGSGNTTIISGSGGGGYRLGSGTSTVIGGNGADTIAFGAGLATVTGGGGADVFTFTKGLIVDPATNGGFYNSITDFSGAGNGNRPGDDMIRFVGFSSQAKLSYVGDTPGDGTGHIYAVDDGGYHASFVVHYAHDGAKLVAGDYGFFAA